MAENDSAVTILYKSILYPFSSLTRLLVGWLVVLGAFVLVGIPFLFGFVVRCGRNVLYGNDRLPDWRPSMDLIPDGLRAFVIVLVYIIANYALAFIIGTAIGTLWPPSNESLNLYLISISLKGIIVLLVTLPVFILGEIALILYIDTRDLPRALNPGNCFEVFMFKPLEFIKACIIDYIAIFIVYLPSNLVLLFFDINPYKHDYGLSQLCLIFAGLLIFLALMAFIANCIRVFIWAKFYNRAVEGDAVGQGPATPVP